MPFCNPVTPIGLLTAIDRTLDPPYVADAYSGWRCSSRKPTALRLGKPFQ